MGLVQQFWKAPYPALMARHLLGQALADWQEAGDHWGRHLALSRSHARRDGTTAEVEAFDAEIEELASFRGDPERWRLDYLFSDESYSAFGGALFSFWALTLIRLCTQSEAWADMLIAAPGIDPYRLPGFEPVSEAWSTGWLEEFRYAFHRELRDVYPQIGRWLP